MSEHRVSDGTTHWEGCWKERKHHECATAEIAKLQDALFSAAAALDTERAEIARLNEHTAWTSTTFPDATAIAADLAALRPVVEAGVAIIGNGGCIGTPSKVTGRPIVEVEAGQWFALKDAVDTYRGRSK